MKNVFLFLSIIALSYSSISCDDQEDQDTTSPVISLTAPAEGDSLYIGHDIHFDVEFSDNTELASYKVNIHNNFDDHGHSDTYMKATHADETPFSFEKSWTFEAQKRNEHVHHHEIVIPETINGKPVADGKYHFIVYCVDRAGNESYVARNVLIGHGEGGGHEH